MALENATGITVRGSAKIIHEYLRNAINSILYQRGIYPANDFESEDYFDIPIMITRNKKVAEFIDKSMTNVADWIAKKKIKRVSIVIIDLRSKESIERWDFGIEAEYEGNDCQSSLKPIERIRTEIRAIMRQIVSTIGFLPFIDGRCSFDIIIHPSDDFNEETDELPPEMSFDTEDIVTVTNSQTVSMTKFSTGLNTVKTDVVYKRCDSLS